MPRTPIDFSTTYFYKLCCRDDDVKETYIDYTTNFRKRKSFHKMLSTYDSQVIPERFVHDFIKQHGGWERWEMVLIETCSCSDALEAKRRKWELIKSNMASLNYIP